MKERKMVRILLLDDGSYKIEDASSYLGTYRFCGVVDGKLHVGQVCKKDTWKWHLNRLISSVIRDNNKKILMYKKENARLEKLKSELEVRNEV